MNFAQFVFDGACPAHRFLEEMQKVVPWDLFDKELKQHIVRKPGGRPPFPLLLLFKMHLLQVWFGLSDAGCEFLVKDRLSFRKFLDLGIEDRVPDSTTLEDFRHDFEPIAEQVLARLDDFFKEKGLLLKEGNVVDATFIRANSRPHKEPEKNSDIDADHGHKGFGYSATANVDVKTKLVRKVHTTSARPHDSQMLEDSLKGDENLLYADSAYAGHRHKLKGIKTRILYKRQRGKKGEPTPELPPRQKALNKAYARVRARGEHVFAVWKQGVQRAWYRGLERVNQQVQSLAIAYNLRRYGFLTRAKCA
jgi:IS5 family transposase